VIFVAEKCFLDGRTHETWPLLNKIESAAWKYNYAQQISILNSVIRKFKDQNLNLIGVILKRANTEANINLMELQSIDHKNRQKMNFADRWQFRMWIFFHTIFGPNQEDLRKIKLYWPSGRNVLEIIYCQGGFGGQVVSALAFHL
jgi:hypothetical protein